MATVANARSESHYDPFIRVRTAPYFPPTEFTTTKMEFGLTNNPPEENEVNILYHRKSHTATVRQTICFTDLAPELRNRIYEHILPHVVNTQGIIVATPFHDEAMTTAIQPAITRISQQIRSETLQMFYANSTFVAYIQDFNFKRLTHWAHCVPLSALPPKLTVYVKLLSRINCAYQLLDLVCDWRDLPCHERIHLKIANRIANGEYYDDNRHFWVNESLVDQRQLVVTAIRTAEALRREGDFSEEGMMAACFEQLEEIDRAELDGQPDQDYWTPVQYLYDMRPLSRIRMIEAKFPSHSN